MHNFKIVLFNARSLHVKWLEIVSELELLNPDIIFITETWLKDSETECFRYKNYASFFECRDNIRGGGVAVFVHPKLSSRRASLKSKDKCSSNLNTVSIIISYDDTHHLFSLIYRSPTASLTDSKNLVTSLRELKSNANIDSWSVLGDFNMPDASYIAPFKRSSSDIYNIMFDFFDEYGLEQLVKMPTRGENILDLLWTNCSNHYNDIVVTTPICNSDHNTVCASVILSDSSSSKIHNDLSFIRHFDFNYAKNILQTVDWNSVFFGASTVDDYVVSFMHIIDQAIPFVGIKRPKCACRKSLLPKQIIRLIHKKRQLWKKMRHCNSFLTKRAAQLKLNYRIICRQIKQQIRRYKKMTLHKLIIENNAKKFYHYVNNKIKSSVPIVGLLNEHGVLVSSDEEIAKLFNDTFAHNYVEPTCNENLMITNESIAYDGGDFRINVTFEDTIRILRTVPAGCAGPDGITADMIKCIAPLIAKPLCTIFLQSVGQCTFPNAWKCARIVPLYKGKGERTNPNNYRAINICDLFGKCLERLIKEQVIDYIESNNMLNKAQHGFRNGRSTVTNLLTTDCYLAEWCNSGDEFDIIAFDLTKAFDRVQHNIVLQRLMQLGFHHSTVKWFQSFLNNRKQYVRHGQSCSPLISVPSGIIAGSVLGPVLFAIVIDPLSTELDSPIVLFADDFKLLLNISKLGRQKAQLEVNKVHGWCVNNEMEMNVVKSLCMQSKCDNKWAYTCGAATLPNVECIKDLGVMRSDNGSYDSHAAFVASKARRLCGSILNNIVIPDCHTGWKIFRSYVYPILTYGALAWNTENCGENKYVERVQRQYTKRLNGLKNLDYEQRLERLGGKTTKTARFEIDMIFTFKLIHGLIPFNPSDFGLTLSTNNSRGPRFKHDKLLRNSARHFFKYRIPIAWDKLPNSIRSATKLSTFKILLSRWLLSHSV